ncbi:homeobox-leucine zipper protein ATHB-7-like isoform X1 [Corylus avellana]|uniref:homeobox-leucine zipper protein ATHB-7-like isoform X1 n=1 Tax=Corylus avellana TaxID=13451 RepID=UPI001E209EC2|nr:homeobox-leucine zipper protein ATHB-7-like isoform X1 [Corylus avellana]
MTSRRNSSTKQKFSDEQIKALEIMFEAESRPESVRKLQLANQLGLRPHQVAIWFQNRRARLKTKQIERDYRILKANYDTLASSFESLQREHQSLLLQSQKLKSLLGKSHGREKGNSREGKSVKREPVFESNETAGALSESDHHQTNMLMSDAAEETGILNIEEPADGSPPSLGDWCSSFLDLSSGNSQWWEL